MSKHTHIYWLRLSLPHSGTTFDHLSLCFDGPRTMVGVVSVPQCASQLGLSADRWDCRPIVFCYHGQEDRPSVVCKGNKQGQLSSFVKVPNTVGDRVG